MKYEDFSFDGPITKESQEKDMMWLEKLLAEYEAEETGAEVIPVSEPYPLSQVNRGA